MQYRLKKPSLVQREGDAPSCLKFLIRQTMTTAAQQLLLVLATSSMVFDTPCWQVIHSPWVPGNRLACGVRQLFWLLVVDKGEEVAPLSIYLGDTRQNLI